jgi:outer membrane protein assembly factor BamB/tetratricopeptide (TPR) repeat protein
VGSPAASLCAVLLLWASAAGQGWQVWPAPGSQGEKAISPELTRLVHVDDELVGFLMRAERLLTEKRYSEAVRALQALVERTDAGFVSADQPGRYVSLQRRAQQVIAAMSPEAMELYRRLYDPQARRLLDEGLAEGDASALRRVAEQYLHTRSGPPALERLGRMRFDRGSFADAARLWERALELDAPELSRPLLLAKIAAAYHLAGDPEASERFAVRLRTNHAEAVAEVAGKRQKLVVFVERICTLAPRPGVARQAVGGWPGRTAFGDGMGVMPAGQPQPALRWRCGVNDKGGASFASLVATGGYAAGDGPPPRVFPPRRTPRPSRGEAVFRLEDGHVAMRWLKGSSLEQTPLPPQVHPVIVDDEVIYRTDAAVEARDVLTGSLLWRTFDVPLARPADPDADRPNQVRWSDAGFADRGRYALTVAGDRVFALAGFPPTAAWNRRGIPSRSRSEEGTMPASSLAAVSISREGLLLWRVGNGEGADAFVRDCTFLSAPTVVDGRLYVLAALHDRYYVVCLRAEDGSVLWRTVVSQRPSLEGGGRTGLSRYLLQMGSPPAVAGGRVYACTNAGVVASLDAVTGRAVWAYRYPSGLNSTMHGFHLRQGGHGTFSPTNPVLVAGGRVICLPADAEQLLAFSVDGRPLWSVGREGLRELSAVDAARVLLSGPGLKVLSTADGATLPRERADYAEQAGDVRGRPAVTSTAVYASGRARLYRLDLDDYSLTSTDLAGEEYILGNLVVAGDRLVAANPAGVAAYCSYELARRDLTERLQRADPKQHTRLLRDRARLALEAGHLTDALDDLLACRRRLAPSGEGAEEARRLLRETYIAMGNRAETPKEMVRRFEQAMEVSAGEVEKAQMLLRLAKARQRAGEAASAAALVQRISETYGDVEMVDVPVGPDADDSPATRRWQRRVRGSVLAEDTIRRLIELHGQDVYAEMDAAARAALDAAEAAGDVDALLAVRERWPNSQWADDAVFAAAEGLYRRALAAGPDRAAEQTGLAAGYLAEVAGMSRGRLRASASVALAAIRLRAGQEVPARLTLDAVRDMPASTPVAFADVRGTLGELIDRIDAGKLPPAPPELREPAHVAPPLRHVFTVEGRDVYVLRDARFCPLRFGQSLLMVRGGRAVMVDCAAGDADTAKRWSGLTLIDRAELRNTSYDPPAFRLLGTTGADGRVAAVADRRSVTALDVRSAKVLWGKTADDLGLGMLFCMAGSEGVLVAADTAGRFVCVDVASGEVRSRGRMGPLKPLPAGPPQVAGGRLLVTHNSGKTVSVRDLDSGEKLATWERADPIRARLLDDGRVLMMSRELELFDPSAAEESVWTMPLDAGRHGAILAVDGWRAVVTGPRKPYRTRVVDLRSGRQLVQYCYDMPHGIPRFGRATDARLDGARVYVAFSPGETAEPPGSRYGQLSTSGGLAVCCYPTEAAETDDPVLPVWRTVLDDDVGAAYTVMPLEIGRDHVAVTAKQDDTGGNLRVYLLSKQTGEVVETIDLMPPRDGRPLDAEVPGETHRRRVIGPPVILGGRLVVETVEGVRVYAGR